MISIVKGLITMYNTVASSAKRGAKVKVLDPSAAEQTIGRIIAFLRIFMAETVARRITSVVLLAVGVPDMRVAELTRMSDRSVRDLRKKLRDGDDDLFRASGGGRERKMVDVEKLVVEKIESNDYHTQQEIADMVYQEYGIKVHRSTVSRLLKKTASGG